MKMILKKNQVIISVIAIMLIAAGYMNYTANNKQTLQTAALKDSEKYGDLGDATLVSANAVFENVEGAFRVILPNIHAQKSIELDQKYIPVLKLFENKK